MTNVDFNKWVWKRVYTFHETIRRLQRRDTAEGPPAYRRGTAENDLEGVAMRTILDRLGISTKYKGYRMLASAIEIAVENEEAILLVTKRIYPEVAKRFGVTSSNVDKNIRVAIAAFWNGGNRELYNKIVGYEITQRPSNADFIAMIASYIIRNRPSADARPYSHRQ